MNSIEEENILTRAYHALKESFDVQMTYSRAFGSEVDYQIEISFLMNGRNIQRNYNLEIKGKVFSSVIGQLLMQKKEYQNILLVTEYASPQIANKLRELDIPFIDANGNCYFSDSEVYIFVNTYKRNLQVKTSNPSLIFQTSGLQLLFVLLSIPDSENKTYRELAEISGVSLGTVSEVMKMMELEHYLVKEKGRRILFRKDELLQRWVRDYSEMLVPKLKTREFLSPDDNWWATANLNLTKSCWGGEVAANVMIGNLIPADFRIYTKRMIGVISKHKLKRRNVGETGNVKLVERFWNFDTSETIAPPLLVYADLLATAQARNIEVAQIIYDQYLARLVE